MTRPGAGDDYFRLNGAGEMLVYSAADFEDFLEPRPELPPTMEPDLQAVVQLLAEHRWPFRLHATYDETIGRALQVFEAVQPHGTLARLALVLRSLRDDLGPQHRAHSGPRRRHCHPASHGLPGGILCRAVRRPGGRAHPTHYQDARHGRAGGGRDRRHPGGEL